MRGSGTVWGEESGEVGGGVGVGREVMVEEWCVGVLNVV